MSDARASASADPLAPGAAPSAIRAALLPEDRARFDAAYEREMVGARDDRGSCCAPSIEGWRRLAVLQRDPERYRALVRRAAERFVGREVPPDEPLAVTRARVGM